MTELIGRKVRRVDPCVGELVVGGVYTITNVNLRLPPRIMVAGDDTWFLLDAFVVLKQVWILYEWYYDFCENWDCINNIFDSEEKAILAQIEEEQKPQYKNTEQYWTSIDCREVL